MLRRIGLESSPSLLFEVQKSTVDSTQASGSLVDGSGINFRDESLIGYTDCCSYRLVFLLGAKLKMRHSAFGSFELPAEIDSIPLPFQRIPFSLRMEAG